MREYVTKKTSYFDEIVSKYDYLGYKKSLRQQNRYSIYTRNREDQYQPNDELKKTLLKAKDDIDVLSDLVSGAVLNDGEYSNFSFRQIRAKRTAFMFSDLRGCDFSDSVLTDCDFTFANLQNCNFSGAVITNCIFRHANLKRVNFSDADTILCDFTGAEFRR
jgi:BTB/POZ domain-containing protein KCTD9